MLAETLPGWPVFEDVVPALNDLRAARWRLAILSNVDDDLIAATLSRLEVPVNIVVSAELVRSYKPALDHFETFRRESGVAEGAWVHVAQSLFHDIAPARRLGLPTPRRPGDPASHGRVSSRRSGGPARRSGTAAPVSTCP